MEGKKIISFLENKYPLSLQEKWDFSGKQLGKLKKNINKILLCLDYDSTINEQTLNFKPDLIITHHPFFFGKKDKVYKNFPLKKQTSRFLYQTINCAVYSFHTCFDNSNLGMNYLLSHELNLKNIYQSSLCNSLFIGELDHPISLLESCKYIKNKLDISYGLLVQGNDKLIKKIGIIGGGGASLYPFAFLENVDLFVSGDMSHHIRREIIELKQNYLDIPHEVEKIFMKGIKNDLLSLNPTLNILCVDQEKEALVI